MWLQSPCPPGSGFTAALTPQLQVLICGSSLAFPMLPQGGGRACLATVPVLQTWRTAWPTPGPRCPCWGHRARAQPPLCWPLSEQERPDPEPVSGSSRSLPPLRSGRGVLQAGRGAPCRTHRARLPDEPSYCLYLCFSAERLEASQQQNTLKTIKRSRDPDRRNPGGRGRREPRDTPRLGPCGRTGQAPRAAGGPHGLGGWLRAQSRYSDLRRCEASPLTHLLRSPSRHPVGADLPAAQARPLALGQINSNKDAQLQTGAAWAGLWPQGGTFLEQSQHTRRSARSRAQTHDQPSVPSHTATLARIASFFWLLPQPSPLPPGRPTPTPVKQQTGPARAEGKLPGARSSSRGNHWGWLHSRRKRSQGARRGQDREARRAPGRQRPQGHTALRYQWLRQQLFFLCPWCHRSAGSPLLPWWFRDPVAGRGRGEKQ